MRVLLDKYSLWQSRLKLKIDTFTPKVLNSYFNYRLKSSLRIVEKFSTEFIWEFSWIFYGFVSEKKIRHWGNDFKQDPWFFFQVYSSVLKSPTFGPFSIHEKLRNTYHECKSNLAVSFFCKLIMVLVWNHYICALFSF